MNKNESKYYNTALLMDEALLQILEKKDFDFISIKEICQKAGVNRSTFYLHYENTNELLEETIGYIPETISCRYNPGGLFKISNDIMDNPGDSKYGMTTEQLFEAFKILKAKGAKEFGIHAFLASNTVTNDYYPMLAKVLFELAVKLQQETGVHIKFINLSGGIGIPYTPDQEPNDIYAIGEGVHKAFDEVLVPAGMGDVSIFAEMGRFMMAPYGCLVTQAIHEKHIYKEYIGHFHTLFQNHIHLNNKYCMFYLIDIYQRLLLLTYQRQVLISKH